MAEQTGKCTSFGNCSLADTKADVKIPDGADPICPECGRGLLVKKQGSGRSKLIGGLIVLVVVAAVGFAAMKFLRTGPEPPVEQAKPAPTTPAPTTPVPATPTPVAPSPAMPAEVVPPPSPPVAEPAAPPPFPQPVYENMVKVADFWIDKTEVSIGELKAFFPGYRAPKGFTDEMPAVDITWEDAARFAQRNGKRLCKEREWLFALGEVGDLSGAHLSGATMDMPRKVRDNRDENSRGLFNMIGNVSEWVDSGGDEAAFLGGYWYWKMEARSPSDVKKVNRLGTKQNRHHYIGFRCCRDAAPTSN